MNKDNGFTVSNSSFYDVDCPTCKAKPGALCVSEVDGLKRPPFLPHKDRLELYYENLK